MKEKLGKVFEEKIPEFPKQVQLQLPKLNKITEKKYRSNVEEVIGDLQGQLIIKEYSPGKASMSTIESHIKKCIIRKWLNI